VKCSDGSTVPAGSTCPIPNGGNGGNGGGTDNQCVPAISLDRFWVNHNANGEDTLMFDGHYNLMTNAGVFYSGPSYLRYYPVGTLKDNRGNIINDQAQLQTSFLLSLQQATTIKALTGLNKCGS